MRPANVDQAGILVDGLAQTGDLKAETVIDAIERNAIDPDAANPRLA